MISMDGRLRSCAAYMRHVQNQTKSCFTRDEGHTCDYAWLINFYVHGIPLPIFISPFDIYHSCMLLYSRFCLQAVGANFLILYFIILTWVLIVAAYWHGGCPSAHHWWFSDTQLYVLRNAVLCSVTIKHSTARQTPSRESLLGFSRVRLPSRTKLPSSAEAGLRRLSRNSRQW